MKKLTLEDIKKLPCMKMEDTDCKDLNPITDDMVLNKVHRQGKNELRQQLLEEMKNYEI